MQSAMCSLEFTLDLLCSTLLWLVDPKRLAHSTPIKHGCVFFRSIYLLSCCRVTSPTAAKATLVGDTPIPPGATRIRIINNCTQDVWIAAESTADNSRAANKRKEYNGTWVGGACGKTQGLLPCNHLAPASCNGSNEVVLDAQRPSKQDDLNLKSVTWSLRFSFRTGCKTGKLPKCNSTFGGNPSMVRCISLTPNKAILACECHQHAFSVSTCYSSW